MDKKRESGSIIQNLKNIYQQKYGVAVFNIVEKEGKKGVSLAGTVLIGNQKEDLFREFDRGKMKIEKENIRILSDLSERNEIGWATVKSGVLDLRNRFVSDKVLNSKILNRIRCSQAFKGEILRVLYENENQFLVQQSDLTLGWIRKKDVAVKKNSLYKDWKKGKYAVKNKAVKIKIPADRIAEEAEKYLGAEYVLGGKSKKGIDCSGLIQVAYKNSFDIILPRHSWDQKKIGEKVNLENVKTGDLIFLIKKNNKHKHVGIVEKKENKINLIHASLKFKKVVKQDLNKIFENYEFVQARRAVK